MARSLNRPGDLSKRPKTSSSPSSITENSREQRLLNFSGSVTASLAAWPPLQSNGVSSSRKISRASLSFAFPATLTHRWLPGVFPEQSQRAVPRSPHPQAVQDLTRKLGFVPCGIFFRAR